MKSQKQAREYYITIAPSSECGWMLEAGSLLLVRWTGRRTVRRAVGL